MKLLLTSAGFVNKEVSDLFLKLLNKPVDQVKIAFIPTASRTEEEIKYVEESRRELLDLGIKNIVTLNLDHKIKTDEIKYFDAIYVCGGNTFYLLSKIFESGLDKILKDYQGLYVGVSAGSIVVGPNIEISAPWDENDIKLVDTTGLGIVNFAVAPHYQRKEKSIIDEIQSRVEYEIIRLTDNQAVFVDGDKKEFIGLP